MTTNRELDLILRLIAETRETLSKQIEDGFGRTADHLDRLNGRAETNATNIALLKTEMSNAAERVEDVERTVHQIQDKGCLPGQRLHLAAMHTPVDENDAEVTPAEAPGGVSRRDVAIAGGATGLGVVLIKVLEYLSDAVHHLVGWK